ncbi:GntR family transcriptional regulator [Streptomyces sp. NPDC058683]|uniref:GntR family transcriptional regulator n=1 Tax=Streptomyces sp. NPDC058683 TaxID=3346597 RepID=UPI003647C2E8
MIRRPRPGPAALSVAEDGPAPWQEPLRGLPTYLPNQRIEGMERVRCRRAVGKAYMAGGALEHIATFMGRSGSWVRRLLDEEEIERRPSGTIPEVIPRAERELRARLKSGVYRPGDLLPMQVDLARELRVSPGTVSEVVRRLKADGLLRSHPGWGILVTRPSTSGPRPAPPADPVERSCTVPPRDPSVSKLAHIRSVIEARVKDGTYHAGLKLPTNIDIAKEFDVSRPLVTLAFKTLIEGGILVRVDRTQGYFAPLPPSQPNTPDC